MFEGRWVIVWVVHLAGAGTARDSTPPSAMAAKRILTIFKDIYGDMFWYGNAYIYICVLVANQGRLLMELELELEEMELLLLKKRKVEATMKPVRIEAYHTKPAPPAVCPALIMHVHVV